MWKSMAIGNLVWRNCEDGMGLCARSASELEIKGKNE